MNDSAGMNTTPFNLSDIWSIPINSSAGEIRSDFGRFMESGPDPEVSGSGDVDMEQSAGTGGFARKRRENDANAPEDDVCIDNMSDSDAKRLKTSGFGDDDKNSKVDGEASSGKEEQKPKTPPEPFKDYIHVRARRGQATDSHSLAERARREKISDRMRVLQDLVPNCNKVIGKAPVLDEIINYVQSLQRQVEFLSMKLETVNTRITPGLEAFPAKDFGQQAYGTPGMVYGSQSCEPSTEYGRTSSPEWLHMQLGGGGFGRQT